MKSGDQIKCNELLAESFCIIEKHRKEHLNDNEDQNSRYKFQPTHCQRKFTFDDTIRGETPFGQPFARKIEIGAK